MPNPARRKFKAIQDKKANRAISRAVLMGKGDGSSPKVATMPGYVYYRDQNGVGIVYNDRVVPRDNLAIFVGYDDATDPGHRLFQVLSTRMADYALSGQEPVSPVGPHADQHEWGGGDDVSVDWRLITGFRVGRPAVFVVTVDPGVIKRAGVWEHIASQTVNLAASVPAARTDAIYALIYLDANGVAQVDATGTVAAIYTILPLSFCPVEPAGCIPLAAVRLYCGQTAITDTPATQDIIDLRFPQSRMASTTDPGDLGGGVQGDILRKEAADWAAYSAKTNKAVLIGDGTNVVSRALAASDMPNTTDHAVLIGTGVTVESRVLASGDLPIPTTQQDGTTLTIDTGAITVTSNFHKLDAATGNDYDDLDTINGGAAGQILLLQVIAGHGHVITVRHGVGNIYLNDEANVSLSGDKALLLFCDSTGTKWSDVGGGGGAASRASARVYGDAWDHDSSGSWVAVPLTHERWDNDTLHANAVNNTRLTATTAGVYVVQGSIVWVHNATGNRGLEIVANAGTATPEARVLVAPLDGAPLSVSAMVSLAAGGYVELYAYQNSGGTLGVQLLPNYSPEFSMARLGLGGGAEPEPPTTAILDNFNRANEGPPPSASWSQGDFTDGMKVLGNEVVSSGGINVGGSFWNVASYGPDIEVYATISAGAGQGRIYWACASAISKGTGYFMLDANVFSDSLALYHNGLAVKVWGRPISVGDTIRAKMISTTVYVYHKTGGIWSLVGTHDMPGHSGTGYFGIGSTNETTALDDFGGGTL